MCQNSSHDCDDRGPPISPRARRKSQAAGGGLTSSNGPHVCHRPSQRHVAQPPSAQQAAHIPDDLDLHSSTFHIFPSSNSAMTALSDLSKDEILDYLVSCIEERVVPAGRDAGWCYRNASLQPPITPDSLAELDMPRIINNPKLRHDVNFDRELHFRPNTDGFKGRQKMQQTDQYWKALEAEFAVYAFLQQQRSQDSREHGWDRILKIALVRLPNVFAAVRDILKTLVPDQDQSGVTERLDVDHLVQEIHHGVCDLVNLGTWLGKVLKNHCAPMRDSLVDAMQKMITSGAEEEKPSLLVNGLRQLMNILEAMKLDVANHQIRHMRPLLIDDTVHFQQRYNAHRISSGKINVSEAAFWLRKEVQSLEVQGSFATHREALVHGLIRELVTGSPSSSLPSTFYLDSDRLRVLQNELQSAVYLELCQQILEDILSDDLGVSDFLKAHEMLHASTPAIVGSGKFDERLDSLAVEIVRVVSLVEGRCADGFDFSLLDLAEKKLHDYLRLESRQFHAGARDLIDRLVSGVQARVSSHMRFPALKLQDLLVPRTHVPSSRALLGFGATCAPERAAMLAPDDPDEDLVCRLTHILVLHWQVWAELAYLVEGLDEHDGAAAWSEDDETESGTGRRSTGAASPASASCSSTSDDSVPSSPLEEMPAVDQVVFADGHKFVPSHIVAVHIEPSGNIPATGLPSGVATATRRRVSLSAEDVASGLPAPPTTPEPEADASNSNGGNLSH